MQADKLAHKRKSDTRPLEASRVMAFHPMKPLENTRKIVRGYSDTRILDDQPDMVCVCRDCDANTACPRIFEGIGDEVEDDLFPHAVIHTNRMGQACEMQFEGKSGTVYRGAEATDDFCGDERKIRRLEDRIGATGLDTAEFEQGVDETQQPQGIAIDHIEIVPRAGKAAGIGGQSLLQRAKHQGQRRSELMADIGKEVGFGLVQRRQFLRTAPFFLDGARIAQSDCRLLGEEGEKAPVADIELARRADSDNQQACKHISATFEGEDQNLPHGVRPKPSGRSHIG